MKGLVLKKKKKIRFTISHVSYLRKSLTVKFPYFRAISLEIFIVFLDSTKLKIAWIKTRRSISKRITNIIFLNNYTPPPHTLTHIILIVSK